MKSGSPITKLSILAGLLCCVALAAYAFMVYEVQKNETATVAAYENLNQRTHFQQNERSLSLLMRETQVERDGLDEHFIRDDTIVPFLDMIEKIGKDAGVSFEVTSVTTTDKEEGDEFESLHLVITAEGKWENVYRLLSLIETVPYSVVIGKMSLDRREGALWVLSFEFDVAKIKAPAP